MTPLERRQRAKGLTGAGWTAAAALALTVVELGMMAPTSDLASWRVWWTTALLHFAIAAGAALGGLAIAGLAGLAGRVGPRSLSRTTPVDWMIAVWALVLGFAHGWPVARPLLEGWLPRPLALALFAVAAAGVLGAAGRCRSRSARLLSILAALAACLAFYLLRARPLGLEPRSTVFSLACVLGAVVLAAGASRLSPRSRRVALALLAVGFVLVVRFAAPRPHSVLELAPEPEGAGAPHWTATAERPPVVFIVADTLRADAIDLRTGAASRTPNLAALAARGDAYTNVVANASWTLPGHASLFTGLRPSAHRVDLTASAGYGPRLDSSVPTLHETFAERGYETSCVVANGIVGPSSGLVRGCRSYRHPGRAWMLQTGPMRLWYALSPSERPALEEQLLVQWTGLRRQATGDEVVDFALRELDAGDGPHYLFLNFMDVHKPYPAAAETPDEVRRTFLPALLRLLVGLDAPEHFDRSTVDWYREAYDEQVGNLDRELGRLFEALRERGLFDRALIVVTSDHGEAFFDNEELPLYYDHHGGYEAAVRIPLIVKPPGSGDGRRIEEAVDQTAIAPLVLEMIDGDRLALASSPEGISSEWNPHPEPGAMSTLPSPRAALYRDGLKLVVEGDWRSRSAPGSLTISLFDLARSPFEGVEVAEERSETTAELTTELLKLLGHDWESAAARGEVEAEATEEQLETLRSLGYLN